MYESETWLDRAHDAANVVNEYYDLYREEGEEARFSLVGIFAADAFDETVFCLRQHKIEQCQMRLMSNQCIQT